MVLNFILAPYELPIDKGAFHCQDAKNFLVHTQAISNPLLALKRASIQPL